MALITSPETVLFNTVESILKTIRTDFKNNSNREEETIIWRLVNGIKVGKYDYYEQGKSLFVSTDDQKRIEARMLFDAERAKFPTIHVTMPVEAPGPTNSLGLGRGNNEPEFSDNDKFFEHLYQRSFKATYNLVVSSKNSQEVVLIYRIFQALLTTFIPHLHHSGLLNIEIGGHDLRLNQEPHFLGGVFMRSLTVDFFYHINTPSLEKEQVITDIVNQIVLVDEI